MRFNKNNIFVFFNSRETATQVSEILKKKFPAEKDNLIEAAYGLSDAEKMLEGHSKKGISFDIIMLDLKLPINVRREFIEIVNRHQGNYECIIVTNNCQLKLEDKNFFKKYKAFLIPFIDESALIPLLENIIEKRFNEKKNNLIKRIDAIVNLKSEFEEILKNIVNVAYEFLGLKICSIILVDCKKKKLKIGALTGMGDYEKEFRENFDISLSEKAVITECIRKKKQIQYENVLNDDCPFKYKEFAKKVGLKSILVTPIYDRRGGGQKKILATLSVYTKFNHKFQADELKLAERIAAKANIVLSQKVMFEEEKGERKREIGLIEKVAAEINKNVSDYKKVFKTIVDEGINLVHAHRGCIKLYDRNSGYIRREYPEFCKNLPCSREKLREPDITSYVIKNKKSVIIPDIIACGFKDLEMNYGNFKSRISVPLKLDEDVIGVLTAEHMEKKHFNERHLQLFEALAKHAVIAIENTRRYKQLKKRWEAQQIIKELIEETSKLEAIDDEKKRNKYRTEQLDRIVADALKKAGKIFDAIAGIVVLATLKDNYAHKNPKWQFGLRECTIPELEIGVIGKQEVTFKGEKCITGKVIAEGKLYNCINVEKDEYYLGYGKKKNDKTKSEIVVPLKFQNQTFGAFTLDSNEENGFSEEDEEILESIAAQMALLIRSFRYLNSLLDLNKPFEKIDNLDQLYNEILIRALKVLETRVCYLRILDRDNLVIKGSKGLGKSIPELLLKVGDGIAGKVAQDLKPKIVPNVQDTSYGFRYLEFAKRNNLFAMISVPIFSIAPDGDKDLIGVINSYANRICDFTSLDEQLMLAVAEKASGAIKKAKLIKQLDEIAKVDKELITTSEKAVLQDIADAAKNLLDADQVVFFQYNANFVEKENLGFSIPPTVSGKSIYEKIQSQVNFTEDSFVVLLLSEESNEFFIESYENNYFIEKLYKNRADSGSHKRFYEREQLKSVIILKLTYKKEVVGIVFINYRYPKSFSSEDIRIAKTFANKAAIAINNIRKYEDINRLHNVGNIIASEPNLDKVLEKIALNAKATLSADIVIVHRYDKITKKAVHPPIQSGHIYYPDAIKGQYGEKNVISNLIEKNKDVFTIDVKTDELFRSGNDWKSGTKKVPRFTEREKIKSCAAMLLKVRNEIVGVMFINYRKKQKFETQQKRTIKVFANQAAIAIRNANLIEESRETIERISVNLTAIQKSGYKIVKKLNKAQVTEPDILQPILSKALELIDVNMGYIGLVNKEERNTKIMVCSDKYEKLLNKSVKHYYPDTVWIKKHKKFDIFPDNKIKVENIKSDYKRFAENDKLLYGYHFEDDRKVQSALRVPIYSDKELLGMIILESEKLNAFSKIDAYAVMSLANQASMALQNYRLIQQLRELRKVDFAILKEQYNLDKVLEVILKAALDLVKKKYADIKFIMDNGDLIIKKSIPRSAEGKIIGVRDCLSGIAVEKKKTYYEKDVSRNPRFLKTAGVEAKSELVIPLMVDKEPIGVLNIESEILKDFTKEDINILEMLAGQASIAIHNAQLSEKNRKRREELKALRDIDQAILDSKLELPDTLKVILTKGLELIGEKHGSIILYDENKQKLMVMKSTCPEDEGLILEIDECLSGLAFKRGETIYKKSLDNEPLYKKVFKDTMKSELVVPLKVSNKTIGVINIESEKYQAFEEDEKRLIENLSGAAAIAIDNAQKYDEVEKARQTLENSIDKEIFAGFMHMHNVFGHEISNSVGIIRLDAIDLLENDSLDKNTRGSLKEILESAEEAFNAFNEVTAKGNKLISAKNEIVHFSKIADDINKNLTTITRSSIVNIKIKNFNKLPHIKANYSLLYDGVFVELIRNATKAMPDGGQVNIEAELINTVKKPESNQFLKISVSDNGCGIPAEKIGEIFNQGSSYWGKGKKGKGAGLFYMKSIIDFLGGEIKCESQVGEGTTFIITLPITGFD